MLRYPNYIMDFPYLENTPKMLIDFYTLDFIPICNLGGKNE